MNTTASFSSEHSWSRRCSTETVFSIQGKETDIVRDTSDTEWSSEHERDVEYEPVTEEEDDGPVSWESSGGSDNEIITTKVIEVSMRDDGDLVFADSEQTESNDGDSDSEIDLHDYWYCAQCLARNNNPLYRYCEKCFKVRKNFFPPRPKRKHKRNSLERESPRLDPDIKANDGDLVATLDSANLARLSQDSGVESLGINSASSQDLGSGDGVGVSGVIDVKSETSLSQNVILSRHRKRRAESADRKDKRMKVDYSESESDSDISETKVKPLVKMVSDPSLSVQDVDTVQLSKKAIINSLKENLEEKDNMCIVCFSKPKSGVFVHGRIAHICCCYNCAVKVWAKAKRCPVCNCKVSNVLRAVVM